MSLNWLYGVILFPAMSLAQVCDLKISTYEISGENISQIAQAISLVGPIDNSGTRRDAFLNWNVEWHWDLKNGRPDYNTTRVSCSANLSKPKLKSPEILSAQDRTEWERYMAALEQHEDQHYQLINNNYLRVAEAIAKAVSAEPELPYPKANRAARAVLAELRQLDRNLDQKTDHGRLDGVKLISTYR